MELNNNKFVCSRCGEYDIIPVGLKTHKCSHCGYRNKVTYENATPLSDEEKVQIQPSFVIVICPYCGSQNIVYNRAHNQKCNVCHQSFSVMYDDEALGHSDGLNLNENDGTKVSFSKVFRICLLIGAIIFCLCSLCSSPDDNTPLTDKYQTTVIVGVKDYLRHTLKDPDSYQDIEWSQIGENNAGRLYVRHKYRAKNSFGGYVVENKIFYLDKQGHVVGCEDYY